jgi:hypothetical protein
MYIIEFEKEVYATKGNGDPARTLKIANAKRFSDKSTAKEYLDAIKSYRKFPNAKIKWVDEVTGKIKND